MKSFKCFLTETEIKTSPNGDVDYYNDLGTHHIITKFKHLGNDHYTVGVARKTKSSRAKETDKTVGRDKIPPENRYASILAAKSNISHFIREKNPTGLTALGNTEAKRQEYKTLIDALAARTPGSSTTHSDTYSKIYFPPKDDKQAQNLQRIKQSNLDKIRSIGQRRKEM